MQARAALVRGCEAAALVLAQQLSLGDTTRDTDQWPIDPSDTVLRMAIAEQPGASLILAVNDEVADRLLADRAPLVEAFRLALRGLGRELGIEVNGTSVDRSTAARPTAVAEILDDLRLTALAGVTLNIDFLDETSGGSTRTFEPQQLDTRGQGYGQATPLTVLNEVMMTVTAELGRTTMPVRDLLGLTPGMVVEIDRMAGAPIDLLVNGRRIAVGEVVVIDEEFGIRITEITPPDEMTR